MHCDALHTHTHAHAHTHTHIACVSVYCVSLVRGVNNCCVCTYIPMQSSSSSMEDPIRYAALAYCISLCHVMSCDAM